MGEIGGRFNRDAPIDAGAVRISMMRNLFDELLKELRVSNGTG
jgi:hypothetical protein